jgi:secreted trypsin-like serine protease
VDEQDVGIQDGSADKSDSERIVGGVDAQPGRFAHQVALFSKDGQFMCGGSLIALDLVVTAAHCSDYVDTAKIGLYSQYDDSAAESISVCDKVSNPAYGKSGSADDICLLRLCQKSQIANTGSSAKAKTIRLNDDPNLPTANQILTVTGWGATSEGGSLATNLQQVNVNYITPTECGTIYSSAMAQAMLCAGVLAGGKDACQGDSGGPIIVEGSNNENDILVGIVSWGIGKLLYKRNTRAYFSLKKKSSSFHLVPSGFGYFWISFLFYFFKGCARPNYPGVYTRISYELSWILQEGCKLSKTSPCGIETVSTSSSATTTTTTTTETTIPNINTGITQIPPPPPESEDTTESTTTSDYSGTYTAGYNIPTLPPSTALPTTPQPTTSIPVTPPPITESPTTMKPTTAKPTTMKPISAEPTTMKPISTEPTTMRPTTEKPVTAKPTTAKPVTARPMSAKPITSQPMSSKPVTARPITAKPATAKPMTTRPVTAKPITAKPVTAKPTMAPKTNEPTRKPTSLAPTTASPTRVCQDWKFFYTKYGGVKRDCSWVVSDPSLVIQRCQDYGEIVCPVTCGFCIPANA